MTQENEYCSLLIYHLSSTPPTVAEQIAVAPNLPPTGGKRGILLTLGA